jgi:hypothetical protein
MDRKICIHFPFCYAYQPTSSRLKAIVALVVLRNKAIKPLLAAAQNLRPSGRAQNPTPLE